MNGDLERLQGEWRIVSLEIDGAALPVAMLADAQIHVAGERFVSIGMGAPYGGTLRVSDDGGRATLSLSFENGPEAGRTNHGIYAFGERGWTLCLDMNGGPAPAAFSTSPGCGCALQRMERA